MKISLIQMCSSIDEYKNTAGLDAYFKEASENGSKMVFAPEFSGALTPAGLAKTSLFVDAAKRAAAHYRIWAHIGSLPVRTEDGLSHYNRSFVIDDSGKICAYYDKIHLFKAAIKDGETWDESNSYRAGTQVKTVRTPLGTVGLSTCYDVRFPGMFDLFGRLGTEIIAVPSAFTKQTGTAHWHLLLRARAVEAQAFVVAAAQSGCHEDGRETYGHSLVVDPWGAVLLDMGQTSGIGHAYLDLRSISDARRQVPALKNKVSFYPVKETSAFEESRIIGNGSMSGISFKVGDFGS